MLKLYTWSTQNARKISVMLEECELAYEVVPVDIMNDAQFSEAFKRLNPNSKIPVLVDLDLRDASGEPVAIFETGAILLYLAEKAGRFLPSAPADRVKVMSWLFWQCSGVGPVFGNFAHFASALAPDRNQLNGFLAKTGASQPLAYPIERFSQESYRLLGVLDQQLSRQPFVAGDLSIADFAAYPWVESAWSGLKMLNPARMAQYAHVARWMATLAERPGVQRGMARLAWGVTPR